MFKSCLTIFNSSLFLSFSLVTFNRIEMSWVHIIDCNSCFLCYHIFFLLYYHIHIGNQNYMHVLILGIENTKLFCQINRIMYDIVMTIIIIINLQLILLRNSFRMKGLKTLIRIHSSMWVWFLSKYIFYTEASSKSCLIFFDWMNTSRMTKWLKH